MKHVLENNLGVVRAGLLRPLADRQLLDVVVDDVVDVKMDRP